MKVNELMIGNWVKPHQCMIPTVYCRVEGIYPDGTVNLDKAERLFTLDELNPAILTPEILEKNFEGKSNIFGLQTYILDENNSLEDRRARFCLVRTCNDYIGSKFWVCDIEYVHQLQHALKLFNIEKEIEL